MNYSNEELAIKTLQSAASENEGNLINVARKYNSNDELLSVGKDKDGKWYVYFYRKDFDDIKCFTLLEGGTPEQATVQTFACINQINY